MKRFLVLAIAAIVTLGLAATWTPAEAQFGKLKDKVKQKAEEKATKKADEVLDKPASEEEAPAEAPETSEETPAPPAATGGTATSEDMTLYTKYDFVPGDKVIFYDDLSREEMGEFPSRWKLDNGVFEIAQPGREELHHVHGRGDASVPRSRRARCRPSTRSRWSSTPRGRESKGHWFHIHWVDAEDADIGNFGIQDNLTHEPADPRQGPRLARTLAAPLAAGLHTMRDHGHQEHDEVLHRQRARGQRARRGRVPAGRLLRLHGSLEGRGGQPDAPRHAPLRRGRQDPPAAARRGGTHRHARHPLRFRLGEDQGGVVQDARRHRDCC